MRFSLYTLVVTVLLAGSVMAFVWRFPDWRLERELPDGVYPHGFSPDGTKVFRVVDQFSEYATAKSRNADPSGYIHVVDIASGSVDRTIEVPNDVYSFSSDRKYLAWFDPKSRIIRVIEPQSGREVNSIPYAGTRRCARITFADGSPWIFVEDAADELSVHAALPADRSRDAKAVRAHAFVYRSVANSAEEYEVEGEKVLSAKAVPFGHATEIQTFPAQRRSVILLQEVTEVAGYDWASARLSTIMTVDTSDFRQSERGQLTALSSALSHDASLLAVGADDLRVFRVAAGTPVCIRAWNLLDLSHLQFSADNTRVFTSEINTVQGATTFRELSIDSGEELSHIDIPLLMHPSISANEQRVLFYSYHDVPPRVYIRNHRPGWIGQLWRPETWLMLLFVGLLAHRFISWLHRGKQTLSPAIS